jgi:L-fuconolactonase
MVQFYDAHAHLFTSDTDRYPINIKGVRIGEEVMRRKIAEDPVEPDTLLRLWDDNGVTGGCAVQYNAIYKTDNSYTLDATQQHPDRLSAVVILNAAHPTTPQILRAHAEDRGAVGLRLYGPRDAEGNYPWLDSSAALDTWATADQLGLTMVVMYAPAAPSADALGHIAALAERFPQTRIAIDHFGWTDLESGGDGLTPGHLALKALPNICFKFTSINFNMFEKAGVPSAPFLRAAVDAFGAERMMWGSDYGNTPGPFPRMIAQALAATDLLTDAERRQVLHDTGHGIFAQGQT